MPLDPDIGDKDYETFKEEFAEKIIETFARYAPNMTRKNIIAQYVYTGREYVAEFPPAAVARDQLPFAVAELSTHENQRVTKALNDALQAVLTNAKPAKVAMDEAQAEATRILKPYQK